MSKRFLIALLVIIIGFGGIFWLSSDKDQTTSSSSQAAVTNHLYGDNSKGVTLLEYGDYQCPACFAYHATIKTVIEKYKTDIHFQFRNFPLIRSHKNALSSARAAEAADKQGKFWEMHNMLYETQDPNGQSGWVASNTPLSYYTQYAQEIGLNIDQFTNDFNSSEINAIVNADLEEAQGLGLSSTPTFFLNGSKVNDMPGPSDQAGWSKLVEDAISAKLAQ